MQFNNKEVAKWYEENQSLISEDILDFINYNDDLSDEEKLYYIKYFTLNTPIEGDEEDYLSYPNNLELIYNIRLVDDNEYAYYITKYISTDKPGWYFRKIIWVYHMMIMIHMILMVIYSMYF